MVTQEDIQKEKNIENIRREMRRRSLDLIKIFNPTNTPRQTIWEGFIHNVPANSEGVLPRYIAEKWLKEFVDDMINRDSQSAIDAENSKRSKKGWQPMNLHEERETFIVSQGLITSNEELRMKYYRTAYRGIAKEHGLDVAQASAVKKRDSRPVDERLLKALDDEINKVSHLPDDDYEESIETKQSKFESEISDE